jgi:hypothetical protein
VCATYADNDEARVDESGDERKPRRTVAPYWNPVTSE